MVTFLKKAAIVAGATVSLTAFNAIPAHALSFTAYTDLASWQAAAGSTTVETFNSSPTGLFGQPSFGPIGFNGFSVSGSTNGDAIGIAQNTVANGGDNYPIPGSFVGQNFLGWGNGGDGGVGPTTILTFANGGTRAFGFDWFNTDFSDQYSITLDPGGNTYSAPPFTVASSGTTSGFWGVVADGLVQSATIQTQFGGGYISTEGLDNVRTATKATAVPTPALLPGLIGMGIAALRKRKGKAVDQPSEA